MSTNPISFYALSLSFSNKCIHMSLLNMFIVLSIMIVIITSPCSWALNIHIKKIPANMQRVLPTTSGRFKSSTLSTLFMSKQQRQHTSLVTNLPTFVPKEGLRQCVSTVSPQLNFRSAKKTSTVTLFTNAYPLSVH